VADRKIPQSAPSGSSEDFEFAALSEARNYRAAIAKLFSPYLSGDILEVGAGVGQMLSDVMAICQPRSTAAVEPDLRFFAALRSAVPTAEVWQGSEQDIPADRHFDALYAINVLEHISDDRRELALWHERIKPGGTICLLVPARPELYSSIDADFGHFRRYTKEELTAKLASVGFADAEVNYFNVVGYFAWLLNFKILNRRHFDPAAVRFFDRCVFPLCHKLEAATGWRPVGQSLVAIAKS
jgi:SAM-dependent methyltransferase